MHCIIILGICNEQTHALQLKHAAIYELERYGKVHEEQYEYEEVTKKGICRSRSAANRSSLCAAV